MENPELTEIFEQFRFEVIEWRATRSGHCWTARQKAYQSALDKMGVQWLEKSQAYFKSRLDEIESNIKKHNCPCGFSCEMVGPLQGQIALVTGASRGIGRTIAWRLARADCDVILLARSAKELTELALEIKTAGREAMAIPTDLRDAEQIERAVKKALGYFGRIDLLVNNAGLWHYAPVQEMDIAEWDEMFDVNVRGSFLTTKFILPSMLERKRGHIVNIVSVSGLIGEADAAGYNATKWAMRGFSYSLLKEVREKGIRVTVVNPGGVNNDQARTARAAKLIQNEDVAELVYLAVTMPPRSNSLTL